MPTQQEIPGIVADVERQLVDAAAQRGVALEVTGQSFDDDWLYVVVTPSQPGVRASDHADLMAQIERGFKRRGIRNVLLVPALSD
jgi:hypothetical protein